MSSIPLNSLPEGFPHHTPTPKFQIGDRVRWQPQPTEDLGTITGIQYTPAQGLQSWAWRYIVWLDLQSPSQQWIRADTAWETDLELISAITHHQALPQGEQS